MGMSMLKFSISNRQAKLKEIEKWLGYKPVIYSISLPSGHSCPFAVECLSKSDRVTGKIVDGKDMIYRCFSASDEARSPAARRQRWHNFDILRELSDVESMVEMIYKSVPDDLDICRVHVGGDFFNQRYFEAWMIVARLMPARKFYAYTKSIPYWVDNIGRIPENFVLNGSKGGSRDSMLDEYSLKVAEVVMSLEEAEEKELPIDHNEYYALNDRGNFGLLIHGTQPKGSESGKAIKELSRRGVKFSYNRG
jgi:hypothetical protein